MTKKDYIKIAGVVKNYLDQSTPTRDEWRGASLINAFCEMLKNDNSNFNSGKFINYIND